MAYTVVDFPAEYFNTKLYTGTGATQSITGVGFQPDWVWTKSRSNAGYNHQVHDVIRGANKVLWTNLTNAEGSADTNGFLSFQSDGFNLGADTVYTEVNVSGQTYASWNWLANGTGVSNTAGTISSTVSANTTSGFSIVSYTGTGANATVGHGLGVAPKMMIVKNRSATAHWQVYHISTSNTASSQLSGTGTPDTASTYWNDTSPTSTLFSIGTGTPTNGSGNSIIAYCFAEVKGYSKFGSYTGNGSTDGTFTYTGFKPAFVLIKPSSIVGDWYLFDNKRIGYNDFNAQLYPNLSNAEAQDNKIDLFSNGFKIRSTGTSVNGSGTSYIYMAFSESPFVSSKAIPTTAR